MIDLLQIYYKARKILSNPDHWTQGCLGRDPDGFPVSTSGLDTAVSFCAVGALAQAYNVVSNQKHNILDRDIVRPLRRCLNEPVVKWQDSSKRTHREVLDLFDRAIYDLEMQESER